ncbi:MAG: helix-turn-helix transcriptional regulator [Firmicutes bacterium]|nr:helix-turn-helix transcriptional regulator [Bacillota bacterium]
MEIGERLKELRKKRGMSQVELSKVSGVSQQAISNTETGRNDPSAETIRMLSSALGVSTSELLGEDFILEEHKLTPREYKMISEFRKLNPSGQKHMIELATMYQNLEEYRRK